MNAQVEQARRQIRAGRKEDPSRKPPWRPPEIADFSYPRAVLAFDASLSNTGWVYFSVGQEAIWVGSCGTIRPVTGKTGYLATWEKAAILRGQILSVTDGLWDGGTLYVVEAPPVGGGHRTESSLIAGMTVWQLLPGCEVVSATQVSAVLLGDPRVRAGERKQRIREAVIRLVPEAAGRTWNEHERDALAVGLTAIHYEQKKAAA